MIAAEAGEAPHSGALRLPDGGEALLAEGVALFNSRRFFECHDVWEELWNDLRGPERIVVQGLIHAAVGCYHAENGNVRGAVSQLGKALAKLPTSGPCPFGLAIDSLIARLAELQTTITEGGEIPGDFPVIGKCESIA